MHVKNTKWMTFGRAAMCGAMLWATGCAQQHEAPRRVSGESMVASHTAAFVNVHALIIVRHADVDIDLKRKKGDATPLLPAGEARAEQLEAALRDAGITRVFTTQTERTEKTARISVDGKIPVESAFAHGADAADVLDYLASHTRPDDVVLLVENHGSIKGLLTAMGYPGESLIEERTEYDRCYVVLPDAKAQGYRVLRLRYGGDWGE
ncbi:MAG: histidine phosphatase family protein [Phycisphaerae bacterium]